MTDTNICIEVVVRRFYTSDEADFTKQSTFDVAPDGNGPPDWGKLMAHMVERTGPEPDNDFPLSNVREMTLAEANAYRAENDDAETSN